jgi:hypothetical protein
MVSNITIHAPPTAEVDQFYPTNNTCTFMPSNAAWPQEVVQCVIRIPNAWVQHLINLESYYEAFTAIQRLIETRPEY